MLIMPAPFTFGVRVLLIDSQSKQSNPNNQTSTTNHTQFKFSAIMFDHFDHRCHTNIRSMTHNIVNAHTPDSK